MVLFLSLFLGEAPAMEVPAPVWTLIWCRGKEMFPSGHAEADDLPSAGQVPSERGAKHPDSTVAGALGPDCSLGEASTSSKGGQPQPLPPV